MSEWKAFVLSTGSFDDWPRQFHYSNLIELTNPSRNPSAPSSILQRRLPLPLLHLVNSLVSSSSGVNMVSAIGPILNQPRYLVARPISYVWPTQRIAFLFTRKSLFRPSDSLQQGLVLQRLLLHFPSARWSRYFFPARGARPATLSTRPRQAKNLGNIDYCLRLRNILH